MSDVMRINYRQLSVDEVELMRAIKLGGQRFHGELSLLGESRELSLAKTKIEEAVMWATKHLTR